MPALHNQLWPGLELYHHKTLALGLCNISHEMHRFLQDFNYVHRTLTSYDNMFNSTLTAVYVFETAYALIIFHVLLVCVFLVLLLF